MMFLQRSTISLSIGIAAMLCLAGVASARLQPKVHDFGPDDCRGCHVTVPREGEQGSLSLTQPVTSLCARCHRDLVRGHHTHPVDIRPSKTSIPPDMPLTRNGRITCTTCHDFHAPTTTSLGNPSHLLRRPGYGSAFCGLCHEGDLLTAMGTDPGHASHGGAIGYAHVSHVSNEGQTRGGLDSVSLLCVSCHDGTYGSSVDVQLASTLRKHGGSLSHPVGIRYELARLYDTHLKPLSPKGRLPLYDGQLGCATCHDPYSKTAMHLAMDNRESRMCMTCHEK